MFSSGEKRREVVVHVLEAVSVVSFNGPFLGHVPPTTN